MSDTEDAMEIAKAAIEEAKSLKEEIRVLKMENKDLRTAVNDPTKLMKVQGWMRFTTPHADETFDPLNRSGGDEDSFSGPFTGSGDLISKASRYEELKEWEDAEREMRP